MLFKTYEKCVIFEHYSSLVHNVDSGKVTKVITPLIQQAKFKLTSFIKRTTRYRNLSSGFFQSYILYSTYCLYKVSILNVVPEWKTTKQMRKLMLFNQAITLYKSLLYVQ